MQKITFSGHIHDKIKHAWIIKRNFVHMDKHIFILLYKFIVIIKIVIIIIIPVIEFI